MKSFQLDFSIPTSTFSIQHGEGIVLQGSCFSDEMAKHLKSAGHSVSNASFGTIFHPTMLAINILNCFEENVSERIFQRDELFFSWDCSSTVFAFSEEALQQKLIAIRNQLKQDLVNAKVLIVTFGSAWGYELAESNDIVANCHKVAQSNFQKFLSSPYEMLQDWLLVVEKLKIHNPSLQIVFTVSPVRHIKDGLVENNLSKARLIEVVQQLVVEENCHYFPSYELLMDVLRDYRFYNSDKIHPSSEAVGFIWENFEKTFCTEETIVIHREISSLRAAFNHKSLYGETKAHLEHESTMQRKRDTFLAKHPAVIWELK